MDNVSELEANTPQKENIDPQNKATAGLNKQPQEVSNEQEVDSSQNQGVSDNIGQNAYVSPVAVHPLPRATRQRKASHGRKKGSTKSLQTPPFVMGLLKDWPPSKK